LAAREYAIAAIDNIEQDSVDRIDLARLCNVQKWLLPAFSQLCLRKESLTAKEADRLEIETYADLCKVREIVIRATAESKGQNQTSSATVERMRSNLEKCLKACKGLGLGKSYADQFRNVY